ncbi:protein of unknown function DUF178 [Candidatus Magnetoovum chiemensis]|nr:protein of unknown function DUF178 [Candidatus Magnetoovum chiemensis]
MKIGKIAYANLYPIFYYLERGHFSCQDNRYEFISGTPSEINSLLRRGIVDAGPASSVEYLRRRSDYILIDGHSISAKCEIKSIILFSALQIKNLHNKKILATAQSETSVALLRIILNRFYNMNIEIEISNLPLTEGLANFSAYMLIGDSALIENANLRASNASWTIYAYDLCRLWHDFTGLPFVFALWIAKKDAVSADAALTLKGDLDWAKVNALKNIETLAHTSPYKDIIPADTLISYWQTISYDLNEEHIKGLELFDKYLNA